MWVLHYLQDLLILTLGIYYEQKEILPMSVDEKGITK